MLLNCQGVSDEIFMTKLRLALDSMNNGRMIKKLVNKAEEVIDKVDVDK